MNSRERVIAALNHHQPDHVPVDFGGHRSSGISAIAYGRLRNYLGLERKPVRVYDMIQQLAIIDEDVLDLFGVDTIELGRGFCLKDSDWKEWVLPDGRPCLIPAYIQVRKQGPHWYLLGNNGMELAVQKEGCLYFEQIRYPYLDRSPEGESFDDLPEAAREVMWSVAVHPGAHLSLTPENLVLLKQGAQALRGSTDRAIVALAGGSMFEAGHGLFRMDEYLMNLGLYPDAMHRFHERLCEIHLAGLEKWLGAVGPYVDVVCFGGDDLGSQTGLLISPAMYREFVKPYHRKLWQRTKELANVKVMLHSCGAIEPLLGDIIEAGADAVNPVQISCAGMEAGALKKQYGRALTFWGGGCDTRDILPQGSQREIAGHVHQQMATLCGGGGFVFQQVHNIQANVPPENIVTMFEAARGIMPVKAGNGCPAWINLPGQGHSGKCCGLPGDGGQD